VTIDRYKLVARHNPVLRRFDPFSPFSVGNGEFAFTADITGFQTFPEAYRNSIPLCTLAQWGWHTTPAGATRLGYGLKDLKPKFYESNGRKVAYPTGSGAQAEVYHWLRENPHKFHLGQIGLIIMKENGTKAGISDLTDIEQTLNLWRGVLTSRFAVGGHRVTTQTCCHPEKDVLGFSVFSQLLLEQRLKINIAFPYGSPEIPAADWLHDERHSTEIVSYGPQFIDLLRLMDHEHYFVRIAYSEGMQVKKTGRNSLVVEGNGDCGQISLVCAFSPFPQRGTPPRYEDIVQAGERYWAGYWQEGGIVEMAESTAPKAEELERRIILSQYLTAIQCAGSLPPQETGLTCNSWYGKYHLEMHWWHAAHFPLWSRPGLLERSMWWYRSILASARERASAQGYDGVRWPKMTAYKGVESPSSIGPLLIWQQPHPIYFAELIYRARQNTGTLEMYREIVFETAAFLASFVTSDPKNNRYLLGPPVIPAQENHDPESTVNPLFELEYWVFGLKTANQWRKRLGLPLNHTWAKIGAQLGPLPVKNEVYLAHERCGETFTDKNYDHPSMLGALGILPGCLVDREIMLNTLNKVRKEWNFEEVWGWDFPMMAMTAARLGRPDLAIEALLWESPKNTYLPNGHNRQGTGADLPLYLPGNGGLLTAVGMMAAGWDNCPMTEAPGFPKDGKWKVNYEGLLRMP